ncbi:MAG TPA: nuclear transport factor 2 family protein [Actinomycetota bacterium]|nr:nuclear transport factor 2 family protein [Actinomycetota bacterium]
MAVDDERAPDLAALLDLNSRSFLAEDEHSREQLSLILHDDFEIVRANGTVEDRETMLARIAADTSDRTREIDEERVRVFRNAAVVRSRVTLKESNGDVVGRFWNTKTFVRSGDEWRCVAWQVTAAP